MHFMIEINKIICIFDFIQSHILSIPIHKVNTCYFYRANQTLQFNSNHVPYHLTMHSNIHWFVSADWEMPRASQPNPIYNT